MSGESGISTSQPVPFWDKPIQADLKEFLKVSLKALADAAFQNWNNLALDGVDALAALGLSTKPEELAWLLIYRSLTQAMFSLLKGNQDLLVKPENFETLNDRVVQSLESIEVTIDRNFFQRPKESPIIGAIKTPFAQWLENFVVPAEAQSISDRLPAYFVFALHEEWAKHPDKYACLQQDLDTPFTKANERERAWLRYAAWLQKQIEEPMFGEAFSLNQVYISPRAYYQRQVESRQDNEFERIAAEKQHERIIVALESELEAWLDKADRHDAIRVISGGPGSGKSSFSKIFAAKQLDKGKIPVLFIPLHHFDPADDLIDAIGRFVSSDPERILPPNPLAPDNAESRLLIIFDGLDELAMQGKIAADVAQQFVREVQKKVDRFNQATTRLQVLISGRELVVQANSSEFRQAQQILHILPYLITEDERESYVDAQNLLEQDQRWDWWQKYGRASGRGYTGLPQELNRGNLTDITAQPLLNYLVALSFGRGQVTFSQETNLNTIYQDLLTKVYERCWAEYQHPTLGGIDYKSFVRVLEEIALATWHGDGRTTTVGAIESYCDRSGSKDILKKFEEGAKSGVTRLLLAFYFRESGFKEGEKTFEFTHKSFGEYLTAKRIVREVGLIYRKLEARRNDPDEGWNKREALTRWAILCGASPMDEYLFHFIVDEIHLQNSTDVGNWQQTLCDLIDFMLRHGMPIERLTPRPDFQEENRQARNAEEGLLAVLNACARVTKKISRIEWHSPEAFSNWISRLQGQRVSANVFCLSCLSFLDLQNCILSCKDLAGASLDGASLDGARLDRASLDGANLDRASLDGANLARASLDWAILDGASLNGASLNGAILDGASLNGAILDGARLDGASLDEARLDGARLNGAILDGARLDGARLDGAILDGASLKRANLTGTILEGKDLTDLSQESNAVKAELDS